MPDFLSRINLSDSLEKLLKEVALEYSLGSIKNFEYIPIGFEDFNVKLETTKGKYVVKIFSKDRQLPFIQDYLSALILFVQSGIPTPTLIRTRDDYLFIKDGPAGKLYLSVMEFFDGKSFNEITPTPEDFLTITSFLAKIHTLNFKIHHNYDTWSTSHLLTEFPKKKQYLKKDDFVLIEPIIEELATIDFSQFRRCIIHGALEKQNILKNNKGEYCILDLGCMDFNAAAIDLAIFLAAFCLDPSLSLDKNRHIYDLVLEKYLKTNNLNRTEINTMPLLVKASYAAYVLTPSYLKVKENDSSMQVKRFLLLGRNGLRAFKTFH